MTDSHFSLFRGKARSGIGEGPGSQVGVGEQYLASDKEVFTEAICTSARPWLTLDSPEQALSERLESWSCFPANGFLFVARLLPVRVAFDARPTYFTHARAFPLTDALAPRDPGGYIGVSTAFDAAWLPEARPVTRALPPLDAPRPPTAEWEAATNLLGHLYQSFVRNIPVVIAANPADCTVGGRLFALVSYARAALPWSIKKDYRARLFTREARLFLKQLGAHLVVIPESVAAEALEARRDALLLDAKVNVVRGQPLGPEARAYAETLHTSVEKLPHGLLPFAARAAEHLSANALPTAHDVLIAQAVYNLSAAGPGQMDSLFRFLLTRLSAEADSTLPFERIVRPEEMGQVSDKRLKESLLFGAGGEVLSPSATVLLGMAAAEARRKRLTVDEEVRAFAEPLTDAQFRKMGWLAREGVLSAGIMAQKTVTLPLGRVADILPPFEALGHERKAGVLGQREPQSADLSAWADRDRNVRDLLLDATAEGILSDRWLTGCGERADAEKLTELAGVLLDREPSSPHFTAAINGLLPRMGSLSGAALRRLRPSLEGAAKREDPLRTTKRYVEWMALLAASGEIPASVQQTWQDALGKIRDPALRQWIVERGVGVLGVWFDIQGALRVPTTWDRDIAAFVLGNDGAKAHVSFESIARLARNVSPSERGFEAFVSAADREAASDLNRATQALVQVGVWQVWRGATHLSLGRRFAHAWLLASHSSRRDPPLFEEWEAVLHEFGGKLEDSDLPSLLEKDASGRVRPCWPWIAPYQLEQLQGLARLCTRLDYLIKIARAVDPLRDLGWKSEKDAFQRLLGEIFSHSPLAGKLDPAVVGWLARSQRDVRWKWPFDKGELPTLLSLAGSFQGNTINLEIQMPEQAVVEFAAWLTSQPDLSGVTEDFLRRLDIWVNSRGDLPDLPEIQPRFDLANQLRAAYPSLLKLVDPPRGTALYTEVLAALQKGEGAGPAFGKLVQEIEKWKQGGKGRSPHPLHRLANAARERPLSETALYEKGEMAFLQACSLYPALVDSVFSQNDGLPVLDFLLALVPTEEELPVSGNAPRAPGCPGAVACRFVGRLIEAPGLRHFLAVEVFWDALFVSLTAPERRTRVVPHRPVSAVVELLRLRPALKPYRIQFDGALKRWLNTHVPGRNGYSVGPFPGVLSAGAQS